MARRHCYTRPNNRLTRIPGRGADRLRDFTNQAATTACRDIILRPTGSNGGRWLASSREPAL
jgi:hypothetical protein